MKHELKIIETATGQHVATVSASTDAALLVDRAKRSAVALHKDFHFEVVDFDTLEATIVPGKAPEIGVYGLRGVSQMELRNRVEIWSPTKWVITMGAGELDPSMAREQYKSNAHMLRNGAVFRVYDIEKGKYLPAIKKSDYHGDFY